MEDVTEDSGCLERPWTSVLEVPTNNLGSAQYWCSPNGTTFSYREYNGTSCNAKEVSAAGNFSVPFTRNGFTFDCECWESKVFVEAHKFNASDRDGQPGVHLSKADAEQCRGPSESEISMSGSCVGFFDNGTTLDGYRGTTQMRSTRVTCDISTGTVQVEEFADSLDCDITAAVLSTDFKSDQCVVVRNKTMVYSCAVVGGGKKRIQVEFGIDPGSLVFLLAAFFYLCFVVTVVTLMYLYSTGMICKSRRSSAEHEEEEEEEPVKPTEPERPLSSSASRPATVARYEGAEGLTGTTLTGTIGVEAEAKVEDEATLAGAVEGQDAAQAADLVAAEAPAEVPAS